MEVAVAQVVGRREVGERKEDPGRRVLVGAALARDGGGQVFGARLAVQLPEPFVASVSGLTCVSSRHSRKCVTLLKLMT